MWACAIASPTALAKPWPRGPVVTSIPGVSAFLGVSYLYLYWGCLGGLRLRDGRGFWIRFAVGLLVSLTVYFIRLLPSACEGSLSRSLIGQTYPKRL